MNELSDASVFECSEWYVAYVNGAPVNRISDFKCDWSIQTDAVIVFHTNFRRKQVLIRHCDI